MTATFTREDYIYYARLAEQGERYEDMIRYMKEVSRVSYSINLASKLVLYQSYHTFGIVNHLNQ